MATNKELATEVKELRAVLEQYGLLERSEASVDPADRADYVAFGSPEHAQLLGLIDVEEGDDTDGMIVKKSPTTGKSYRLEDEVTPYMTFPDPKQVATLVLRQKISSFESGPPLIPKDAPAMWRPRDLGTGQ